MPTEQADHLVLDGLAKRFGHQVAVEGMSLSVARGEFISLLGPSGCGKTTTLQMIAGFVEPSAGSIRIDGRDLTSVKPSRRDLGIVFQSYALFPHCTVAENIAFGLQMRGVGRDECRRRVDEALELVGLSGFAERYPRRMSGGQQQRVALARALVIRPAVLLLDEPLSNLDAKLREDMQVELREIQRTVGTTTLLVTHDQSEAMALSNRIVIMNGGRVEQIGTPQDVYAHPATPFVASFLGKTNVFAGRARAGASGAVIEVDGQAHAAERPVAPGPVSVQVRPERVRFSTDGTGVRGRVRSRYFHGASWLYQIDSAAGPAVVIAPNDGSPAPQEGEAVLLTWRAEDMQWTSGGGT